MNARSGPHFLFPLPTADFLQAGVWPVQLAWSTSCLYGTGKTHSARLRNRRFLDCDRSSNVLGVGLDCVPGDIRTYGLTDTEVKRLAIRIRSRAQGKDLRLN